MRRFQIVIMEETAEPEAHSTRNASNSCIKSNLSNNITTWSENHITEKTSEFFSNYFSILRPQKELLIGLTTSILCIQHFADFIENIVQRINGAKLSNSRPKLTSDFVVGYSSPPLYVGGLFKNI